MITLCSYLSVTVLCFLELGGRDHSAVATEISEFTLVAVSVLKRILTNLAQAPRAILVDKICSGDRVAPQVQASRRRSRWGHRSRIAPVKTFEEIDLAELPRHAGVPCSKSSLVDLEQRECKATREF